MTPRLYVNSPLKSSVSLTDQQYHYVRNVMRLSDGQHILVFNGIDGEWSSQLNFTSKKAAELIIGQQTRQQANLPQCVLLCCMIKPAKFEFVIEKATELGATHIQPLISDFCQVKKMNVQRFESQAIDAAQQSERMSIPSIGLAAQLKEYISSLSEPILWADERREQTQNFVSAIEIHQPRYVLIGPEGGFSPDEKSWLDTQNHIIPAHLGSTVLRAETASIAALAILQAVRKDNY